MKSTRCIVRNSGCFLLALFGSIEMSMARDVSIDETITIFGEPRQDAIKNRPQAISYIDEEQLALLNSPLTLSGYLNNIPSLYLQGSQNFSQDERVSIRGFGAQSSFGIRGIQILVDDIPHTLPDGQSQIDGLDLHNLAYIEVMRGPNSALYGNSSGGVINIKTKSPDDDQWRLALNKGSFDTHQVQLYGNKHLDDINFGFAVNHIERDGYREHSDFERRSITGHFDWQITPDWYIKLHSQLMDSPTALDPGSLTQIQAATHPQSARDRNVEYQAGEQVKQKKYTLTTRYQLNDNNNINVQLYQYDKEFKNRLPFKHGGQVNLDRNFWGSNVQYATSSFLQSIDAHLVVGLNYQYQDDFRQRYNNLSGGQRGKLTLAQQELINSSALYSQLTANLTKQWLVNLGARYEQNKIEVTDKFLTDQDQSGQRIWKNSSINVGSSYQLQNDDVIYANISESFQIPTTTELYNPALIGGFNPNLRPEQATNYELGYRGQFNTNHTYDIAIFTIDIKDALTPFYSSNPEVETTFYQNAGELTRQGIEISTQHTLSDEISLTNQYSYSDFKFGLFETPKGDYSHNKQAGIPKHKASSQIMLMPSEDLSFNLNLLYVGDRYVNHSNVESADHYFLATIGVNKTFQLNDAEVKLSLTINNIFKENYDDNIRINAFGQRYYEPAPQQEFMFTLTTIL